MFSKMKVCDWAKRCWSNSPWRIGKFKLGKSLYILVVFYSESLLLLIRRYMIFYLLGYFSHKKLVLMSLSLLFSNYWFHLLLEHIYWIDENWENNDENCKKLEQRDFTPHIILWPSNTQYFTQKLVICWFRATYLRNIINFSEILKYHQ